MKTALWIGFALLVLGYGAFEARRIVEGPQVTILTPQDGSATSSTLLRIEGVAENVSFLTVNDLPVFTDTSGHFLVTLSPPAGYTIITAAALDRFGRRRTVQAHISVLSYCPASTLTSRA